MIEYAQKIARAINLPELAATALENQMLNEAGFAPRRPRPMFGPLKISAEHEEVVGESRMDAELALINKRLNNPLETTTLHSEVIERTFGRGLSRRTFTEFKSKQPWLQKYKRAARRRLAKHPFTNLNAAINNLCDKAQWHAGWYKIDYGTWFAQEGHDAPYEGLVWYSAELHRTYHNARTQIEVGNSEGAAAHAYRAGILATELSMLLAHGELFEKYQAVNAAQREGAAARKRVSDEIRQQAYWRHRKAGNKKVQSGVLAGADLHLSEASIRSAFPGGKYPPD